jgi:hypothetical protein
LLEYLLKREKMRVLMFALMCVALVGIGYSYRGGDGYTLQTSVILAVVMAVLLVVSAFLPP